MNTYIKKKFQDSHASAIVLRDKRLDFEQEILSKSCPFIQAGSTVIECWCEYWGPYVRFFEGGSDHWEPLSLTSRTLRLSLV